MPLVFCKSHTHLSCPWYSVSHTQTHTHRALSLSDTDTPSFPAREHTHKKAHIHTHGRAFTIRTDHQALTALLATQGSGHRPMRLLRWADRLNQYNFRLEFMPGRANTVADLLPRAVSVTKEADGASADTESDEDWVHILQGPLSSVVTLAELQQASADDDTLTTLRSYVQDG